MEDGNEGFNILAQSSVSIPPESVKKEHKTLGQNRLNKLKFKSTQISGSNNLMRNILKRLWREIWLLNALVRSLDIMKQFNSSPYFLSHHFLTF